MGMGLANVRSPENRAPRRASTLGFLREIRK